MSLQGKTVAVDREQLAWAAGFFDGEGNVGFTIRRTRSGTTHRSIWAQVAQSERELLDRFTRTVGVGNVRGPYTHRNVNAQPYHCISLHRFEFVQHLAAVLWPWLGSYRRGQFSTALREYAAFQPEVALCEHGAQRLKCRPCRVAWTTDSWRRRKEAANVLAG